MVLSSLSTFGVYGFVKYQIKHRTKLLDLLKKIGHLTHIERKGVWAIIQHWLDRRVQPEE